MAPVDPPPSSGAEASAGSTPPTWPDVSRTSRGYQPTAVGHTGYQAPVPMGASRRAPVWIGAVAAAVLGVVGIGLYGGGFVNPHPKGAVRIGGSPGPPGTHDLCPSPPPPHPRPRPPGG